MDRFLAARREIRPADRARLLAWSQGSPGRALALDVEAYVSRRKAMLVLLRGNFADLLPHTEALGRSKSEKLEFQLDALYTLLGDLLRLHHGSGGLVNEDLREELAEIARRTDFDWLERAVAAVDRLEDLIRRNIQKQIALEALAVALAR